MPQSVQVRRHRDRLGEQVAERTALLEEANRKLRTKAAELEAKAAEARGLIAELEAEHSRREAVFHNMPAGVIIFDLPGRRIILSNRQAEVMLGRSFKPGETIESYLAQKPMRGRANHLCKILRRQF